MKNVIKHGKYVSLCILDQLHCTDCDSSMYTFSVHQEAFTSYKNIPSLSFPPS